MENFLNVKLSVPGQRLSSITFIVPSSETVEQLESSATLLCDVSYCARLFNVFLTTLI